MYVPPFISQILDFFYCTVLIFILIYFEWRDTENQQLYVSGRDSHFEMFSGPDFEESYPNILRHVKLYYHANQI